MIFVVQYGCLSPIEGRDAILAQLWLARLYYNDLVAIENGRRVAIRTLVAGDDRVGQLDVAYEAEDERVEAVVAEIKRARVAKRGRGVTREMEISLAEAKQERYVVGALRSAAARAARVILSDVRGDDDLDPFDPSILRGWQTQPQRVFGEARRDVTQVVLGSGVETKTKTYPRNASFLDGRWQTRLHEKREKSSAQAKRNAGKARKKKLVAMLAERGITMEEYTKSPFARIKLMADGLANNARKFSGLYPGTYLRVEKAIQAAKNPPRVPGRPPPAPFLSFKRFDGEGCVGPQVQWQGRDQWEKDSSKGKAPLLASDLFVSNLFAEDDGRLRTLARIAPVALEVDPNRPGKWLRRPGEPRRPKAARTTLRIRVASDEKDRPVWATLPMLLDRPLPDGVVKWVSVSRRLIGAREQWSCEITLDEPPRAPSVGSGKVVLHCGWYRERDGRIRVATWMDERGDVDHVHLSVGARGVESGLDKADSIESIRSRYLDSVIALLTDWLDVHADLAPEWMLAMTIRRDGPASRPIPTVAQAIAYMRQWRAPGKLAALIRHWHEHRFAGDDDAFFGTEWWRYVDHHLWNWQRSQEVSSQRRRKDDYRVLGATLAKKYGVLVLDDVDYSTFARQDAPGGVPVRATSRRQVDVGKSGTEAAYANKKDWINRQRRVAAPSVLRGAVKNAFKRRGGIVQEVDARNESIECPKCDEAHEAQQHVEEHYFACSSCTFEAEVDTVACLNALRRAGCDEQVRGIIERMGRRPIAAE